MEIPAEVNRGLDFILYLPRNLQWQQEQPQTKETVSVFMRTTTAKEVTVSQE